MNQYNLLSNVKCDIHEGDGYKIVYLDSEWIYLSCASIIIRADSIGNIVGINSIAELVGLYGLQGITNGRLLILECHDSVELLQEILEDALRAEGLWEIDDFVVFWDDLIPTDEQFEYTGYMDEAWLRRIHWLEVIQNHPKISIRFLTHG